MATTTPMTGEQKILRAIAVSLTNPATVVGTEGGYINIFSAIRSEVKAQNLDYSRLPGAYTDRQWPWAYSMALAKAAVELLEDSPAGRSHAVVGAALFPLAKAHLAAVAADVVAAKECLRVEQMRLPH